MRQFINVGYLLKSFSILTLFTVFFSIIILSFIGYHYYRPYHAARVILSEKYYLANPEKYAYAIQYRIELQQRYPGRTLLDHYITILEYNTFVKYLNEWGPNQ
jgi:hypothetical protein